MQATKSSPGEGFPVAGMFSRQAAASLFPYRYYRHYKHCQQVFQSLGGNFGHFQRTESSTEESRGTHRWAAAHHGRRRLGQDQVVLTCKIANLLAQGVPPYSILAITFTNKVAAEMRERVDRMIGEKAKDVWLSTFHSFCARLPAPRD